MERRRVKQTQSLEERLAEEAKRLRAEAKLLAPGAARDQLIRRAREAETSSHMSEWLRSPGLHPPISLQRGEEGAVRHHAPPKRARRRFWSAAANCG